MLDIGKHCSMPFCHLKDFLPFECSKCNQIFCLDHRTCKAHNCPKMDIDNVMLIICPFCNAKIKITGADDPNIIFDKHQKTECNPKTKIEEPKERCAADGCHAILTPVNTYKCVKCGGLNYCMKHRFSDAHACVPFKATKLKSRLVTHTAIAEGSTERCPLCLMFFPTKSLIDHCKKIHNVT